MRMRKLGSTGLEVSALGLGCMNLSFGTGPAKDKQQGISVMLRSVAKRKNATPVQIALAWLLAQKPWVVPIPGMDKTEYIDDNLMSVELELAAEDLQEIDEAMAKINVQGARLGEGLLSMSE